SNALFNLGLRENADPEQQTLAYGDLSDNVRQTIKDHIATSFGEPIVEDDLAAFRFHHCTLALKDQATHAKGVLQEFFERQFPNRSHPISAIYQLLMAEISNRSGREQPPSNYAELLRNHSLSRSDIEGHLRSVGRQPDPAEEFKEIQQ